MALSDPPDHEPGAEERPSLLDRARAALDLAERGTLTGGTVDLDHAATLALVSIAESLERLTRSEALPDWPHFQ
jgi:hypothetical protein